MTQTGPMCSGCCSGASPTWAQVLLGTQDPRFHPPQPLLTAPGPHGQDSPRRNLPLQVHRGQGDLKFLWRTEGIQKASRERR